MNARFVTSTLTVAATAFVLGQAPVMAQDAATIRVASFLPAPSIAVRGVFKPWMAGVKKDIGDKVVFKEFWGGALGRAGNKQFDLAVNGVADVTAVVPSYTPGRFPGFSVHELPLLTQSGVEGSRAMWRLYEAGLIGGFEKVKLLGIFITAPYRIHTKTPIKSAADIKGLKIRTSGPTQGATMKALGAVPIGISLSESTEALSRGVVDGVLLGFSAVGIFRMTSIAKYHYMPPLAAGSVVAVMNKKKWNSLTPEVQKALEKHAGDKIALASGGLIDKVEAKFAGKMKSDPGHKLIPASKAHTSQDGFKDVYAAWIKKTKNGQKIFDTYVKIIADLRAGK